MQVGRDSTTRHGTGCQQVGERGLVEEQACGRDRKAKRQLEKNSGQQLDRIFLAHMAAELDRQYGNYEDTAMRTKSPEIKHYIETLLSQVKRQDQVAKEMAPEESRPESNPQ